MEASLAVGSAAGALPLSLACPECTTVNDGQVRQAKKPTVMIQHNLQKLSKASSTLNAQIAERALASSDQGMAEADGVTPACSEGKVQPLLMQAAAPLWKRAALLHKKVHASPSKPQ